jgi:hypothetical protein
VDHVFFNIYMSMFRIAWDNRRATWFKFGSSLHGNLLLENTFHLNDRESSLIVSKMPSQYKDKIAAQPIFKRPAQAKVRAPSKSKTAPSVLKTTGKVRPSVKKNGGATKVKYKYEQDQRVRRANRVTWDAGVLLSRIDETNMLDDSNRVPAESYESFAR